MHKADKGNTYGRPNDDDKFNGYNTFSGRGFNMLTKNGGNYFSGWYLLVLQKEKGIEINN